MQASNHLPTVGRVASQRHRYRDEVRFDFRTPAGYRRRVRRQEKVALLRAIRRDEV